MTQLRTFTSQEDQAAMLAQAINVSRDSERETHRAFMNYFVGQPVSTEEVILLAVRFLADLQTVAAIERGTVQPVDHSNDDIEFDEAYWKS